MKKVLFIDQRKGSDFTLDAVWAGLVDRHGWENVIDWPPSEKHREGIPQVTGDVDRDYGSERRSLCYTPHWDRFPRWTLGDINNLLRSGEIERIFIDERWESWELYMQTVARHLRTPVVVVAGHDRFWNKSPLNLYTMYGNDLKHVFMDNWTPDLDQQKFVSPMSYATNFDHLWDVGRRQEYLSSKVYNLCFMGYNSQGGRGVVVDHLIQKYGTKDNCLFVEKRPDTIECFLPKKEYFKKMAQSRVCINLNGAAECGKALRFYEIPYVGSFMLSQRDWAKQVHPFEDGIHCRYFDSLDEMDRVIEWALEDDLRREAIATRGHAHAMKNHTARARVDYIYEVLDSRK